MAGRAARQDRAEAAHRKRINELEVNMKEISQAEKRLNILKSARADIATKSSRAWRDSHPYARVPQSNDYNPSIGAIKVIDRNDSRRFTWGVSVPRPSVLKRGRGHGWNGYQILTGSQLDAAISSAEQSKRNFQAERNKIERQLRGMPSTQQVRDAVGSRRRFGRNTALISHKNKSKLGPAVPNRDVSLSKTTAFGASLSSPSRVKSVQKARITKAQSLNPANFFDTGSGRVTISHNGKVIARDSDEGGIIQGIYDRQRATRAINKEQRKLFDRVTGADNYKDALNFQSKSQRINPNVGTFQGVFKGNELKEVMGTEGIGTGTVVQTDKAGDPIGFFAPKDLYNAKGQRVATINSSSVNSMPNFFESKKRNQTLDYPSIAPKTYSSFDFFGLPLSPQPKEKREQYNDYIKESDKAFSFFPDVPTGKDPLSRLGAGAVKGSSNILASFFNMGASVESGIRTAQGREPLSDDKFVKFYSTPVTNVELGFFDAGKDSISQFFGGKPYSKEQAGKRISTGFSEAYDNFFSDPYGSAGSMVEVIPYVGYGGVKAGSKMLTNFFGKSAPKTLGKTATKSGKKTAGDFVQDFFYTRPDKKTIFDADTAHSMFSSKKADLGRGQSAFFGKPNKSGSNFFTAISKPKGKPPKDFFGGTEIRTKGGTVLIQKTKTKALTKTKTKALTKTKTKALTKTKTKAKTRGAFIPMFKVSAKTKSKQKSFLDSLVTPKLSQKSRTPSKAPKKQKQSQDFFAATTAKTSQKNKIPGPKPVVKIGAPFGFFWGRNAARMGRTKKLRKGKKAYTAWNVDTSEVGAFLSGPAYKKSRSSKIFTDLDIRTKKAASKRRKSKKYDSVSGFFG